MSTVEERRQIRDLTASLPGFSADASSNRRYAPWKELVGANAPPLVATLTLVSVATVALVVIHYSVQLNFVPLICMVPLVIAATQWGILAGIVTAVSGAVGCDR